MKKSSIISAAVALAATQLIAANSLLAQDKSAGKAPEKGVADAKMAAEKKAKTGAGNVKMAADPVGQCFGVVGAGKGECAGTDPATGKSWDCSGNNPTADLGWKRIKKSECDAMPKHKDSKVKDVVFKS